MQIGAGIILARMHRPYLATHAAHLLYRARQQAARLKLALIKSRAEAQLAQQARQDAQEALQTLAASFLSAQEEHQRRVARDLHDDVSQRLASVALRLARLRLAPRGDLDDKIDALEQEVSSLCTAVRHMSHGIHPSVVEELGLLPALQRLVGDFQANFAGRVCFEACGWPEAVASDVALALYRVTQEALRNIDKHAVRGAVTVVLAGDDSGLYLCVQDSGPGFNAVNPGAYGRGLGLRSMQERARLIGGTLTISSTPGGVTKIVVRVPAYASMKPPAPEEATKAIGWAGLVEGHAIATSVREFGHRGCRSPREQRPR